MPDGIPTGHTVTISTTNVPPFDDPNALRNGYTNPVFGGLNIALWDVARKLSGKLDSSPTVTIPVANRDSVWVRFQPVRLASKYRRLDDEHT